MDCLTLPSAGAFTLDSLIDLRHSLHGFLSCKFAGHVEARPSRTWVCSASAVRNLAPPKEKQVELERDRWLSQIRGYFREGKVFEAEDLMRKMGEVGLVPDLFCYNALITAHGKADRFESARAWFCLLESDIRLQPDAVTYRSMIGACGRAGELKGALELYDKMKAYGFRPSTQNFNTLISLHRKIDKDVNKEEKVLGLLVDMREMGCCPDSPTIDVVVRLFERWRILESLPAAISLLKAAGWSPTQRCYSILLKAYIRCSMIELALDVFHMLCETLSCSGSHDDGKDLVSQGPCNRGSKHSDDTHDVFVYNGNSMGVNTSFRVDESLCHSLICLCRTMGRYTEALQVFSDMRHSGTKPSWFTASTVIDICGRLNEATAVERAEALFIEMRSSAEGKEATDAGAYTVTINMFLKAGLAKKAAEIATLVSEHEGLVPDSTLFVAMLRAYSRCGMPAKAVQVYKSMLGVRLTWTAPMFNGVIHCCGRALPLEESIKVFLAMVYAKVSLSSGTCNLMMDIYAKAGLLDKAENVFKLAKEHGVLDAISYNTMIAGYGRFKEYNRMEYAFLEMQSAGFKDHVEAYNSMLDAYGKASQLRRMENTLERMRRSDCRLDLSTYNILINVYGREGLIEELKKIRKSMKDANIEPDSYTFNTLIFAYGNAEMPNEAMGAFKEMQDLNLVADEVTYNCLIAAFERSGNHLEVARWSLWMTQLGMK
ncbi:hypothetical protein GOP47_0020464 [Adiantum capillus-veneris]|uniref:PROP1-like PPR domain-containing protein n=1 Tax=Adiantum capillus-veneris TaxID=13818 RepID=A0A9D4UAU3_ADICA|nr:hypothetical protein GOP47_0020464 [Adiantum capillus-veneris]